MENCPVTRLAMICKLHLVYLKVMWLFRSPLIITFELDWLLKESSDRRFDLQIRDKVKVHLPRQIKALCARGFFSCLRPLADESKIPVAREKKPLVPRVLPWELNSIFMYHIYSINRPGRILNFGPLESGRLIEAGRLLNFHLFQQV